MPRGVPTRKRRRSRGSVTLHKASGLWAAKMAVNGKQVTLGYAKAKSEAEVILATALVDARDGVLPEKTPRFSDWAQRWLNGKTISDKTRAGYSTNIKHLNAYLGQIRLADITPEHIERVNTRLLQRGLSSTSVNSVNRTLGTCWSSAMRRFSTLRDIPGMVDVPSVSKRKPYVLSRQQWKTLIGEFQNMRNGVLFETLLKTGVRVDVEAMNLQWDNLDLRSGVLTVGRSKTAAGEGRKIPLDDSLLSQLKALRNANLETRLGSGGDWNADELVFTNRLGHRLSLSNLRTRVWMPMLQRLGLPGMFHIHDLRHNCGSYLISEGVPITMVSSILGHADVATTLRIYSHELAEDSELVRQAMNRINEAV